MTRNHRLQNHEAYVNVTWNGQNGDLLDPVSYWSSDEELRAQVREAIQSGAVAGITRSRHVDLRHFVVDRFPAQGQQPNRLFLRPKTPFG